MITGDIKILYWLYSLTGRHPSSKHRVGLADRLRSNVLSDRLRKRRCFADEELDRAMPIPAPGPERTVDLAEPAILMPLQFPKRPRRANHTNEIHVRGMLPSLNQRMLECMLQNASKPHSHAVQNSVYSFPVYTCARWSGFSPRVPDISHGIGYCNATVQLPVGNLPPETLQENTRQNDKLKKVNEKVDSILTNNVPKPEIKDPKSSRKRKELKFSISSILGLTDWNHASAGMNWRLPFKMIHHLCCSLKDIVLLRNEIALYASVRFNMQNIIM